MKICPKCGSSDITFGSAGTQQIFDRCRACGFMGYNFPELE